MRSFCSHRGDRALTVKKPSKFHKDEASTVETASGMRVLSLERLERA